MPISARLIQRLLVVFSLLILFGCSRDQQGPGSQISSLDEESLACLNAANAMIDFARQAVNDTNSRPQRRESRRLLMEAWVGRLEGGEDPCSVYSDIGEASISF